MKRVLAAAPIAIFSFMAVFVLAILSMHAGLIPDDAVSLWAGAITAGDGQVSIGHIVAAYPTLPFMATSALEFIAPAGTPTPALLAATLVGCLAGIWFLALRDADLSRIAAGAITLLLIFHPALLRAAMAGPAEVLVAVFLFWLGSALYDLRARGAAPEVMAVSLALLGLAFSHPMGAAIAAAAVPFLVFAVRPALVANSAFNVVLALVFPTVFSVGAFAYVSWVFPGHGWSFYSAPAESLSAWAAGMASMFGGLTGWLALDTAFAFTLALLVGAPIAAYAVIRVYRRRPLVAPPAVLAASTITAATISVATGLFGDPAAVAVLAPILAAIVIIRIPLARQRLAIVVPLLAIGWLGGALGLALVDPRTASHVRAALDGRSADHERADALSLGAATIGRDGVLVDTDNAPAVVLGRGRARGLLSFSDENFLLTTMFARIQTPFVAVPNPQSGIGAQDRLNRTFPLLYRRGAPDYRIVYQNKNWRLFERN